MQEVLVSVMFLGALAYLVSIGVRAFRSSGPACAKGCGACSTIDLAAIERKIREQEANH
jgi:hypothetical protein